jgi:hypothetical protein
MADKSVNVQIGPGFAGTLAIVFIVLKLLGYITWSWVWVLSPLWIGLALVLAIWGLVLVFAGVAAVVAGIASLFSGRR